jgi:Amidohydrolase
MLNTRFGCEAKVRKLFWSAAEGGVRVRSLLLMYIPSPTPRGPPIKLKLVPVVTSELQPFPSVVVQPKGKAAGSLLKIRLFSDSVAVPLEPVSRVLMTLAEAFETKSRLQTTMIGRANLLIDDHLGDDIAKSPSSNSRCTETDVSALFTVTAGRSRIGCPSTIRAKLHTPPPRTGLVFGPGVIAKAKTVDTLMWGSDYPHTESTFPQSHKILERILDGVPEGERQKIVRDNAARLYGFEIG